MAKSHPPEATETMSVLKAMHKSQFAHLMKTILAGLPIKSGKHLCSQIVCKIVKESQNSPLDF